MNEKLITKNINKGFAIGKSASRASIEIDAIGVVVWFGNRVDEIVIPIIN